MGEDPNQSFPPKYFTPIHTAISCNKEEIVQLLLDRGANVNLGDKDGVTPLALAASQNKTNIVRLLTKAGGSKSASILPKLDENQDPLLSCLPPWMQDSTKEELHQKEESIYGNLKKGTIGLIKHSINKTVRTEEKKDTPKIFSKKFESKPVPWKAEVFKAPEGTSSLHSKVETEISKPTENIEISYKKIDFVKPLVFAPDHEDTKADDDPQTEKSSSKLNQLSDPIKSVKVSNLLSIKKKYDMETTEAKDDIHTEKSSSTLT